VERLPPPRGLDLDGMQVHPLGQGVLKGASEDGSDGLGHCKLEIGDCKLEIISDQ
jgi:hypothetical protein